jgi:hypothetical protein
MSSENLIEHSVNMNYTYTSLANTIIRDPLILRKGLTDESQLIQSCSHSSWDDFRRDKKRYLFFWNFHLNDWLIATPKSVMNCEIICHDQFKCNYNCPLIKTVDGTRVPITLKDVIKNPLSRIMTSNELGDSGNTLYDYAIQIRSAHLQNLSLCPIDMRLIRYNHPIYYEIVYNLVTSDGRLTVKRSIVGAIKYKKENGEDYVAFFGTAVEEYVL